MNINRRQTLALAFSVTAAVATGTVCAQAYPARQITLVVSYPAGGDTDALARMYAEKLTARLGQPVVIDNRPGASGTVGNAYVSKAPADGYTLLFTPSTFPIAPLVLKSGVQMDVIKDFTPIILTGSTPLLLVASPSIGVKDLKSMVEQLKAGKDFSYASPGSGSPMHIAAEMFNKSAGVKMAHVPYRGVAPAINDALGGHVATAYVTPGAVAAHLTTGKLVPLAVTERRRSPHLPNVPTMAELGYNEVDVSAWWGVLGPKGLPAEIVKTINTHFNEVLRMPDVVARMATLGAVPIGGESTKLATEISTDYARFGKIVKEFGIQAD